MTLYLWAQLPVSRLSNSNLKGAMWSHVAFISDLKNGWAQFITCIHVYNKNVGLRCCGESSNGERRKKMPGCRRYNFSKDWKGEWYLEITFKQWAQGLEWLSHARNSGKSFWKGHVPWKCLELRSSKVTRMELVENIKSETSYRDRSYRTWWMIIKISVCLRVNWEDTGGF